MRFFILVLPFFLFGCLGPSPTTRAVLDLDYSSTSLGFRNSGALSAGRLLLWDQEEQSLVSLQSDIKLTSLPPTTPVKLEASSVEGISVSSAVKLTLEAEAAISSEVKRNATFEVEDAVRVNSVKIYDAMSKAYRELSKSGVNAHSAWRVADATGNPKRFKYVLLVDEIQASSESLTYDNSTKGGFSFTVIDKVNGNVTVEAPSNTTAKCSGSSVTCYFNASVIKAFINDEGNLDYSPSSFDKSALVAALRSF